MTTFARRERERLCDLALEVGPEAPTLCAGWSTRDLLAHLRARESDVTALPGLVVPSLERFAEKAMRRQSKRDFDAVVADVRRGPPTLSPLRLPGADKAVNTLEYFVHHEDIRRAAPGWEPRPLERWEQSAIWAPLKVVARGLTRPASVGVEIERTDGGDRRRVRNGSPSVTVRGLPSEVALFLFGRGDQAQVELDGDADDVAALRATSFGF